MKENTITNLQEEIREMKRLALLGAKSVLTLEETSWLTGLAKSHLYRLTSRKEIPYYKPNGKLVYFDKSEVEAWMKKNRQPTISEIAQKAVVAQARKEAGL